MRKPRYDFSQFPTRFPATVLYSAKSHVRGKLHMSRVRIDKFYILTGKGPGRDPLPPKPSFYDPRPGVPIYPGRIYEWTMEDQAKLVEAALAETPMVDLEVAA